MADQRGKVVADVPQGTTVEAAVKVAEVEVETLEYEFKARALDREPQFKVVDYVKTDKKGNSSKGKSLALTMGDDKLDYVRWDIWLALSKTVAWAAQNPQRADGLAKAIQAKYIAHAGATNGTDIRNITDVEY